MIHIRRARTGSGGVGFLIQETFLQQFAVKIVNTDTDGIIWLNCSGGGNEFYICAVYLLPEFSAFLDQLMIQIYQIPDGKDFYLCGDWNCRVGDLPDYTEGIDFLPARDIVDYTVNSYGNDDVGSRTVNKLLQIVHN